MTLDEAIKHAEKVADEKKKEACDLYDAKNYEESRECIWCADEHRQLAGWLKDYKRLLEQEPCEDAISRQAVDELSKELVHTTRDKADFLCNFWEGLSKLPPVNPQEPKTGHWISHYDEDAKEGWYECDRCHTERAFNTDYCPDCGARMVEPQEIEGE